MYAPVDDVRPITAAETLPLRHAVLRPMQDIAACRYPLDNAPDTFHAGWFRDGRLVGVASICREDLPDAGADGWRLRGVAVAPFCRGIGGGGRLLVTLLDHAAAVTPGGYAWCNARVVGLGFYRHHGFESDRPAFDLPPIGPHVVVRRRLRLAAERDDVPLMA